MIFCTGDKCPVVCSISIYGGWGPSHKTHYNKLGLPRMKKKTRRKTNRTDQQASSSSDDEPDLLPIWGTMFPQMLFAFCLGTELCLSQ